MKSTIVKYRNASRFRSLPARRKSPASWAFRGADEQIRTADLLITNQLLYQLSYVGTLATTGFFGACLLFLSRVAHIFSQRNIPGGDRLGFARRDLLPLPRLVLFRTRPTVWRARDPGRRPLREMRVRGDGHHLRKRLPRSSATSIATQRCIFTKTRRPTRQPDNSSLSCEPAVADFCKSFKLILRYLF